MKILITILLGFAISAYALYSFNDLPMQDAVRHWINLTMGSLTYYAIAKYIWGKDL